MSSENADPPEYSVFGSFGDPSEFGLERDEAVKLHPVSRRLLHLLTIDENTPQFTAGLIRLEIYSGEI